ncbi:MAG: response regulator transcription factor [Chloroflexales bacterium]|nr:response regulator transcription factor [Chloroflexales bacterium]
MRGETVTLQRWLDALTTEVLEARPWLLLWRAWVALMGTDWPALGRFVAKAEAALRAGEPPESPHWGELLALQGWMLRAVGKTAESYDLGVRALALLRPDDWFLRCLVCTNAALAAWTQGQGSVAREHAAAAIAHGERAANSSIAALARAISAWISIDEGQLSQAAAYATRGLEVAAAHGRSRQPTNAYCHAVLAEALPLLEPATSIANLHGVAAALFVAPLRALALEAVGQHDAAAQILATALGCAAPEGLVRPFLDLGASLSPLLRRLRQTLPTTHPAQPLVCQILDRLEAYLPAHTSLPLAADRNQQLLPEPLSVREREVLVLLAAGATNAQIAEQLIISERTAKKHVINILGKLNAANRTQAVTLAREAGLLA